MSSRIVFRPLEQLNAGLRWLREVGHAAAIRFYWDDCFSRAAALAYATLFALVPIVALSFPVSEWFGLGPDEIVQALRRIISQFVPTMENNDLHDQILSHIQIFSDNVRSLQFVSIVALAVSSTAFMNTIESALNVVWKVTSRRSLLSKAASFWFIVSLGPGLIVFSLYWTAKFTFIDITDPEVGHWYHLWVTYFMPMTISVLGTTFIYYKLPSAPVQVFDAFVGGVVGGLLFEISKRGFAYYVSLSSTSSTVYGVVAAIPLFLFWLYVAWLVILFGAEVAYQSGSIHILRGRSKYATELGEIGAILGLRILYCIGRNFIEGKHPPSESEIAIDTGSDPVLVRTCLEVLREANIITGPDERTHARALIVSPEKLSVGDIAHTFRSKVFQRRVESGLTDGEETFFLDVVRRLGVNTLQKKSAAEWTLAELLQVER